MANDKLAKKGDSGLAALLGGDTGNFSERPDFIPAGDTSGTEGITSDDIRMPRLGIAQGLSPQVVPGNEDHIPGLQLFQMFNSVTKQNYGNGPIFFIVVQHEVRCIEFKDRKDGGGVVDMNVPRHDPRATQWRVVDGKRMPPVATTFHEYLVLLLKEEKQVEPIMVSIKTTNKHSRRAVEDLNGFIKLHASQGAKSVPIYGVIYSIETRFEKKNDATFGVPLFRQHGYIPPNRPDLFTTARDFAVSLKGKKIVVEREPGSDDIADAEIVESVPF